MEYLNACCLSKTLINGALPIEISYISEAGRRNIAAYTASAGTRVTTNLHDAESAPERLSLLLVPGPDPAMFPSEDAKKCIKNHVEKKTIVLTVCTGIFPIAHAKVVG